MIKAHENGICPYCGVASKFESVETLIPGYGERKLTELYLTAGTSGYKLALTLSRCGNGTCRKVVIYLSDQMIQPLGSSRPLPPAEVPEAIARDYEEACQVEPLSKKAAAALARRCLQNMLHDKGIKKTNLEKEIEEAMSSLPSHLSDDIDAIRHVGNFAAHPLKSTNSGEIVEVEPEETEYLLDTLYDLFDHYYVRPQRSATKRAALQQKLTDAGKNVTIK